MGVIANISVLHDDAVSYNSILADFGAAENNAVIDFAVDDAAVSN